MDSLKEDLGKVRLHEPTKKLTLLSRLLLRLRFLPSQIIKPCQDDILDERAARGESIIVKAENRPQQFAQDDSWYPAIAALSDELLRELKNQFS